MERLTIVKVGGKVVEKPELLQRLLADFSRISGNKLLVHGGGKSATAMAERLGIETKMINGRRITDEAMLEVVIMVYAGLVNKKVVAGLQALNCNAIGLTGADMDLIRAKKRPVVDIDYGFAGDIIDVSTRELESIIDQGVVPVIAPLTHDGNGLMLNTNADTIASELAIALSRKYRVQLIFCFEKKGVLADPEDDHSVIRELDYQKFQEYKETGVITEGMIPKLDNGFSAMRNGVESVVISNPEALGGDLKHGTRLMF
ncbi:MAG: acetylglutamate kinase [Bacteroidota bacterium]|nr:acetylglutamate kinase [Bacteroidota bacterium]MDP4205727.1 acetylglutamate kinase [Bacteroidota bacterium]